MTKIFNRLVVVVLVVALLPVLTTTAQLGKKPGLSIYILRDGDEVTRAFEGNVTAHLYGFNATVGDKVSINMITKDDDLDPYLVLLGPRGEVIDADDDSGGSLNAAFTELEIPASGGYFVLASSFIYINNVLAEQDENVSQSLEIPQEYTLQITGVTPPTDLEGYEDDKISYFRGDLEFGTELEGESTAAEPVFYYGFMGTAGQVVNIELKSDEFDSVLHIFGPDGDRLAINDDDPRSQTTNSAILNLELPIDSLYIVFASDLFFYLQHEETDELEFTGGKFTISLNEAQ